MHSAFSKSFFEKEGLKIEKCNRFKMLIIISFVEKIKLMTSKLQSTIPTINQCGKLHLLRLSDNPQQSINVDYKDKIFYPSLDKSEYCKFKKKVITSNKFICFFHPLYIKIQ